MNILVTGASQGIGFELVRIFSSDPRHRIMAVSRNYKSLEKLQLLCRETSGNNIHILSQDISAPGFEKVIRAFAGEHLNGIDILINNAGALISKPFEELTGEDFDLMFNVNVRSVFLLIRELLPVFRDMAHIVSIGSMGGVQGSVKFPGLSLYSSSKGALAVLTECLAPELKSRGIRINCLALGAAATEMLQNAFPGYKAPLTASEMAGFIADFALEGHRYFNGKVLPVALSTP